MQKKIGFFILKLLSFYILTVLLFSGCAGNSPAQKSKPENQNLKTTEIHAPIRIGFDIDDTILFSTPAFAKAKESGVQPYSKEFWEIVNGSDKELSPVKKKTEQIILEHRKKGDEIFVITAREFYNVEPLKNYLNERLGIKKENVYFASKGKSNLIKELGISVFYGDSDSDIQDAQSAGIKGIRIQRSPQSSYQSKYNPGSFREEIIPDSEE